MPNPDILYQPGSQGGGTLTTQISGAAQMGQPPPGFDMSWLQRLAERKAQQEEQDRRFARQMMMKSMPRQPLNRISQSEGNMNPRPEADPREQEIWVDTRTGQPSHPWNPNAMNTGRKFIPQKGEITTGPGTDVQDAQSGNPNPQQRWGAMRQAAEGEFSAAEDANPGRGGRYTKATGMGGF